MTHIVLTELTEFPSLTETFPGLSVLFHDIGL